ncbi:MAG TPA: hypothetical protein VJB92_02095 [Candidatus Paceibacterota bacterium]
MHIPKIVRDRFLPLLMLFVCLAITLAVGAFGFSKIVERQKIKAEFETTKDAMKAEHDRLIAVEEFTSTKEDEFLLALTKGNVEKSNELIQDTDRLIKEMDLVLKKQDKK